jgi:N-formylglutamate amidohydrolase
MGGGGIMNSVRVKNNDNPCSIITSIPHSASNITLEMKKNMKKGIIFANNDWFLNELYDFLGELNINSVSANYSRYVIDVNRDIKNKYIHDEYTKSLVYYRTTFNRKIYDRELDKSTIEDRIEKIYKPYHLSLYEEINKILRVKGRVYLFDLHSFFEQSRADIIIGTRGGKTCSTDFLKLIYDSFSDSGFNVKVDEKGLRGGYITAHYGSIDHVQAVQIEIRYTAYIENRYFGEEEIQNVDYKLFNDAKMRLHGAFLKIKKGCDELA